MSDEVRMRDIKIEKIGDEYCAFLHGNEIARSPDKKLLQEYLTDSVVSSR